MMSRVPSFPQQNSKLPTMLPGALSMPLHSVTVGLDIRGTYEALHHASLEVGSSVHSCCARMKLAGWQAFRMSGGVASIADYKKLSWHHVKPRSARETASVVKIPLKSTDSLRRLWKHPASLWGLTWQLPCMGSFQYVSVQLLAGKTMHSLQCEQCMHASK